MVTLTISHETLPNALKSIMRLRRMPIFPKNFNAPNWSGLNFRSFIPTMVTRKHYAIENYLLYQRVRFSTEAVFGFISISRWFVRTFMRTTMTFMDTSVYWKLPVHFDKRSIGPTWLPTQAPVMSCPQCQYHERPNVMPCGPQLTTKPIPEMVMKSIAIDFICRLLSTDGDNEYILNVTCLLSKYDIAVPLVNITSGKVLTASEDNVFYKFIPRHSYN